MSALGLEALAALALSPLLALAWLSYAARRRPTMSRAGVGAALLTAGAAHAAVAVAAAFDPTFPGAAFGVLRYGQGAAGAACALAVSVLALIGAFAALETGPRPALRLFAALTPLAASLVLALLAAAVTGRSAPLVLFETHVASLLLIACLPFALLVNPFLAGAMRARRRALSPAAS